MKTLELVLIIMLVCFWGSKNLYSQTINWNEYYTTTVLYDDFTQNQLDLNQWSVEDNSYSFNGVIIDSSATVNVNSGKLKLSVISCRDCSRAGETRDLAGGEIFSNESFQYGIFECSAKITPSEASMPNFSFIGGNGNDCANGNYYASEVDIFQVVNPAIGPVDLQKRIYHHHPDTDCKLKSTSVIFNFERIDPWLNDFFDYYHTYKCVWTPNNIRYYVDGEFKLEVTNTGAKCPACNQNWFPTYSSNVHLCNKVGGNMYYTYYTSAYFDWVSVKRFFATPVITLSSNIICTSGTAVFGVDSAADSITWKLTPTNLFSGAIQGAGKIANITAAGPRGQGKITYTFKMPGKEIFTAEKAFTIGGSGYTPVVNGTSTVTCSNALFTEANNKSVYWSVYGPLEIVGQNYGYRCTIKGNGNGTGWVYATNDCGSVRGELLVNVSCGYYLTLTPNPLTGETTVAIESSSKELVVDENVDWEMEIYSEFQELKMKDSKLRGKNQKLQTTGWREGVYVVQVKYKDIILQEKLLVK